MKKNIFLVFVGLFCIFCHPIWAATQKNNQAAVPFSQLHASQCQKTNWASEVKPVIVLDAGHGGADEGAKVQGVLEKRITLTTTLMTKQYLEEMGYLVYLTRKKDIFVSLSKRAAQANNMDASLFVSIHYNASQNKMAKGLEVFYPDAKELWRSHASKRLARCILQKLIHQTSASSRGIKKGNFHVIRETQMPAVLIEGGFVTNNEERLLLKNKEYLSRIAKGIAEGIHKYLGA
ncbi:MAG: N-acetylmuramoyl-L-alanine amidase family protein [Rhabdochlamydiaceae bacterium]